MLNFSRLDGSQVPENCSFAPEGLLSNGFPSSDWEKLQQYLGLSSKYLPGSYQETYKFTMNPAEMELYGKSSQRQLVTAQDTDYDPRLTPMIATTQQVAISDALATTGALWFMSLYNITARSGHGLPLYDQSDAIHTLSGQSYQPFSGAICAADIIRDDTDTRPVAFPLLYQTNDPSTTNANITLPDNFSVPAILYPGISREDLVSTAGSLSQYRLRWAELPQDLFNGSSIGAVISLPQSSSTSSSQASLPQKIILCNLAAGWGSTIPQIHTFGGAISSTTSEITSEITSDDAASNPGGEMVETPTFSTENVNQEIFWKYQKYPQRPINVTPDWAHYLNPTVQSANRSVFDLVMQQPFIFQGLEQSTSTANYVSLALTARMANGLARVGFESTLQGSPRSIISHDGTSWIDGSYWLSGKGNVFTVDPVESKDWVKLHVNSTLQGYAYNTENTSSRVAIAILTMYCVVAIAHLLYSGISGNPHRLAASRS